MAIYRTHVEGAFGIKHHSQQDLFAILNNLSSMEHVWMFVQEDTFRIMPREPALDVHHSVQPATVLLIALPVKMDTSRLMGFVNQ